MVGCFIDNATAYTTITIIATVLYLAFFETGPGPLPFLLFTEMFPNN